MTDSHFAIKQGLKAQQIIFGALVIGVVAFTVVALIVGSGINATVSLEILRITCIVLIASTLVGFMVVKRSHMNGLAGEDWEDEADLIGHFGTINIIGGALAEGPALFGAIIILLGGHPLDLLLVAFPLMVLIGRFPTKSKWDSFVRNARGERGMNRGE